MNFLIYQENMDYKNLILRSVVSIFFISIYLIFSFYNFEIINYLLILIFILILIEILLNFKKLQLLIAAYILILSFSLIFIDFSNINLIKFNLMIIIIISFDIFSYLIGSFFGKNKLFRLISPNKTIEGLFGGILFSILIGVVYSYSFELKLNINYFAFVFIVIILSFMGDIIESKFKRVNNLKNSSNFLPGHGGFFDRFDSFILSLFFYPFINQLI